MSIGILSCVWQRPERLDYTLGRLAQQTNKDWHLYLICNNPELAGHVKKVAKKHKLPKTVIYNAANRGPFARWEVANKYADKHDCFMTLDDDVNFDETLLEAWQDQAADEVMGWNGFIFQSDYWHRIQVEPGQACKYVFGSNMLVPSAVVADPRALQLKPEYWQCDDLWICYVANYLQGFGIRRAAIDVNIEIDGKDTYIGQHKTKVDFLESLRRAGWRV
jgi:hypothetical protein